MGCICPPLPRRHQHHEARQIFGLRAQAVDHPRTHAGAARDDRPGVHHSVRRIVIDLLREHGPNDADIVGHAADVREQFANFLAGLAKVLNRYCGPKQISCLPCNWAICWPLVSDSGMAFAMHFRRASVCSRRSRGATARRPDRGRSRAWLWLDDAADSPRPGYVLTANRRGLSSEFSASTPKPAGASAQERAAVHGRVVVRTWHSC